jgi:hypothetical protein
MAMGVCRILVLAAVLGCNSPGVGRPYPSDGLTGEQLVAAGVSPQQSLYEALEHVRPLYLRSYHGATDGTGQSLPVSVFIEEAFSGGLEQLRLIPVASVAFVRRVSPTDVFTAHGQEAQGGALFVTLRYQR